MPSSIQRGSVRKSSSGASLTTLGDGSAPTSVRMSSEKPRSAPHNGGSKSSRIPSADVMDEEAPSLQRSVSSAGLVSRVLVDVVTSRHAHAGGEDGAKFNSNRQVRASRESTVTAATSFATASSSAMTHRSVCLLEKELGKTLPLDSTGSMVVLSSADLLRVRDAETLQFLQDNSEVFVKYFHEVHQDHERADGSLSQEPNRTSSTAKPTSNAKDIAAHVQELCQQIETFITAVDCEGRSYHVHVDERGELHVPVESDTDLLLDVDDDDQVLADMNDFNEEDMKAFDAEFGVESAAEEPFVPEEVAPQELTDTTEVGGMQTLDDTDSVCESSVVLGSMASTEVAPEDALRMRFDAHRKLLGATGEHRLQKRLEQVVAHYKGQRPRFMQPTAARGSQASEGGTQEAISPSPPPPAEKVKGSRFSVQYCSKQRHKDGLLVPALATPAAQPKPQRITLSADEEDRVRFLLDNPNWETASMADDGGTPLATGRTSSAGSAHTSGTASSSLLSYDKSSAAAYAIAAGGFTPPAHSAARLRSIDEKLSMLQRVREAQESADQCGEEQCLPAETPARNLSQVRATDRRAAVPGSVAPSAHASVARSVVAPSTQAAEEAAAAAAKRKSLGNEYLKSYREDKQVRQALSAINEKLCKLSQDMDELFSPPFSFQVRYDMANDPSEWQWPTSIPKPSDDVLRSLLQQAEREQRSAQRERNLHLLPGSSQGDRAASSVLVNDFVPQTLQMERAAAEDAIADVSDGAPHVAPASYFHEQLRERMRNALRLALDVDTAQYGDQRRDATKEVDDIVDDEIDEEVLVAAS